jgi:hypothetical protein
MNEDLAWLRVQDIQREAENRRLTAALPRTTTPMSRLMVRALASVRSRKPAARPTIEARPNPTSH